MFRNGRPEYLENPHTFHLQNTGRQMLKARQGVSRRYRPEGHHLYRAFSSAAASGGSFLTSGMLCLGHKLIPPAILNALPSCCSLKERLSDQYLCVGEILERNFAGWIIVDMTS